VYSDPNLRVTAVRQMPSASTRVWANAGVAGLAAQAQSTAVE
jgi:hypothetical protein